MFSKSFSEYLTELRQARGMSRRQLRERIGMSRTYLDAIERGYREPGRRETVARLADGLGLRGDERAALFIAAGMFPDDPALAGVIRAYYAERAMAVTR